MKKFAKLIVLVLALMLVLSLAACEKNGEAPAATAVGKWRSKILMAEMAKLGNLTEEQEKQMDVMYGENGFYMNLELTEDGKISLSVDRASVEEMAAKVVDEMPERLSNYLGITVEEYANRIQKKKGMTLEEYKEQSKQDLIQRIIGKNAFAITGIYQIEGDKIYAGDEGGKIDKSIYMTYSLQGDTLILRELVGNLGQKGETLKAFFPWEFTRAD